MLRNIRNLLNGVIYGAMLIVPGISATLFAVLLGFYEEVVHVINQCNPFKPSCCPYWRVKVEGVTISGGKIEEVSISSEDCSIYQSYGRCKGEAYKREHWKYLGVFVLGVTVGSVLFSSFIMFMFNNYSFKTMLFFIGLMVGMIPLVYTKTFKKAEENNQGQALSVQRRKRDIAFVFIAFFIMISLSFINPETEICLSEVKLNMTIVIFGYIFFAGILNGATLVIPGLSGAIFLLIMGIYPLIIYSVSSVGDVLLGRIPIVPTIIILLTFIVGAMIGKFGMARVMEKLMRDHYQSVHAVILGFLFASVIILLRNPLVFQETLTLITMIFGLILLGLGFVLAFVMGKRTAMI